jgi:hypothetical protein
MDIGGSRIANHLKCLTSLESGDLGVLNGSDVIVLANGVPALDIDATELHRLRHLELQLDLKQALVEVSAFHLNVISEIEAPLERTTCDAAIKVFTLVIAIHGSRNNQHVLIDGYIYLIRSEAGDRQCDAIGIFARSRDVTGRVIILGHEGFRLPDRRGGQSQRLFARKDQDLGFS